MTRLGLPRKAKSRRLTKTEVRRELERLKIVERRRMRLLRIRSTRERRRLLKVAKGMSKQMPGIIVPSLRSMKPSYRTKAQALRAARGRWKTHVQFVRKTRTGWTLYRYPK